MKIISWNCNLNIKVKFEFIERYNPVIVFVQECEKLPLNYFPKYKYLWIGKNDKKGMAVMINGGNAKIDPEGKNKSYIPSESIKIIRTRSIVNKDCSKFRIKANKKMKGDLRLGFALDEKGKEFVPISNYELLNSEKIIKDKNTLTFENLNLSKNEFFEFEIKFSSSNNFAVGAY